MYFPRRIAACLKCYNIWKHFIKPKTLLKWKTLQLIITKNNDNRKVLVSSQRKSQSRGFWAVHFQEIFTAKEKPSINLMEYVVKIYYRKSKAKLQVKQFNNIFYLVWYDQGIRSQKLWFLMSTIIHVTLDQYLNSIDISFPSEIKRWY